MSFNTTTDTTNTEPDTSTEFFSQLMNKLESEDLFIHLEAEKQLRNLEDDNAIPEKYRIKIIQNLVGLCKRNSEQIDSALATALGFLANRREMNDDQRTMIIDALIALLQKDQNEMLCCAVAVELAWIAKKCKMSDDQITKIIDALISLLGHENGSVRRLVADGLGDIVCYVEISEDLMKKSFKTSEVRIIG